MAVCCAVGSAIRSAFSNVSRKEAALTRAFLFRTKNPGRYQENDTSNCKSKQRDEYQ